MQTDKDNKALGKLSREGDMLDSAVAAMKAELVRLQGLLNAQTGRIAKPTPYPIYTLTYQTHFKEVGKPPYSRWGNNESSPERALAEGARVYEESKALIPANQAICAENKRIVQYLLDTIGNAGIPSSFETYTTSRGRSKRGTEDAGWKRLGSGVATEDMWATCERSYQDFVKRVAEWQKEIDAVKQKEQREQEQKKATIEAESRRIALCLKYEVDPVTTPLYDLREILLKKNKYLRLAYFLEKNRGDWTDGPSYAENGLSGFTVETLDDHLIFVDINDLIEDWGGDGRCFRDCTWNYGRIYSEFVPPELLADFQQLPTESD